MPAGQAVHKAAEVRPVPVKYVPAAHGRQVLEVVAMTAVEYLPAGQARQVETVAAPLPVEYVPAEHAVQGWGAGGCWGIHTSRLLVSGPLYVTRHAAPPVPSTC